MKTKLMACLIAFSVCAACASPQPVSTGVPLPTQVEAEEASATPLRTLRGTMQGSLQR